MNLFKRSALSVCIALTTSSIAIASKGPTLNLGQNASHTLQFPSEVSQVNASGTSVSVNAQSNTVTLNGAVTGTSELEIMLVGENTPRYITVNVGQTSNASSMATTPSIANDATAQSSSQPAPQQVSQPRPSSAVTETPALDEAALDQAEDELTLVTEQSFAESGWSVEEPEEPIVASTDVIESASQSSSVNFDATDINTPEMFVGFDEAMVRAFAYNPAIASAWHAFASSASDIDFASAGWRPVVDFNASYALERRSWDNYDGNTSFSGAAAGLTLTQSLYDGLRTSSEVRRFEAAQLVSYYELLSQIETTTQEALVAYLDVLRHRELVSLAEQNLERHLEVFSQIEQSASAGVARRADLEQISGRLSLAETNLITEEANLHDVSARYLRLFGELPAYNLLPVELDNSGLPSGIREALRDAYQSNPTFLASIHNIEAQQAAVDTSRSNFRPQVNLVARLNTRENDDQGFSNRRNDGQIALEFNYNIFNGGRDSATLQRSLEDVNIAKSQRDTACTNLRQTLQIALNDAKRVDSQLPRLNQHMISSDSVRNAYKNQFDIGQRTLLDLLDSENEYFQAAIAFTNATFDKDIATARSLGEMGQLLPALNIVSNGLPSLSELGADTFQIDANSACPDVDVSNSIIRSTLL